jgi:hypothetical protein
VQVCSAFCVFPSVFIVAHFSNLRLFIGDLCVIVYWRSTLSHAVRFLRYVAPWSSPTLWKMPANCSIVCARHGVALNVFQGEVRWCVSGAACGSESLPVVLLVFCVVRTASRHGTIRWTCLSCRCSKERHLDKGTTTQVWRVWGFKAVMIHIEIFCPVLSCSLAGGHRCFGGTFWLLLQNLNVLGYIGGL